MKIASFPEGAVPMDDSIVAHEPTDFGWRGLTARGDVLNVRSRDGERARLPEGGEVVVMRGSVVTGRKKVEGSGVSIDAHLDHYNRALVLASMCCPEAALAEIDAALAVAPTLYARFNRAMILLALGRWEEGFAEYWDCECQQPFTRKPVQDALDGGLQPWCGESLSGRSLAVLHAHGYGDTIMALRYVPQLRELGASVSLVVPEPLRELAACAGSVTGDAGSDFFCPALHLVGLLERDPWSVSGGPYLKIDRSDVGRWRTRLGSGHHVGVAWSPAVQNAGDYPRRIELRKLVAALGSGAELHSVQAQDSREAEALGVRVHHFRDFYDCAAAMLAMDRVVTIDTAAVHLAGAVGHPRVSLLLSHWASWRWLAKWYDGVSVCRQASSGDWDSALRQL